MNSIVEQIYLMHGRKTDFGCLKIISATGHWLSIFGYFSLQLKLGNVINPVRFHIL